MGVFTLVIIWLVGIYALIWVYLLTANFLYQRHAVKLFMQAWTDSTYTVERRGMGLDVLIDSGLKRLCIRTDADGNLETGMLWHESSNVTKLPSKTVRKKLEPITREIAVMFKLTDQSSSNSGSGAMAAGVTQGP